METIFWGDFSTMESQLDTFEMKFNENTSIRFSEYVGEEHENKSFKTLCYMCGLDDHWPTLADAKISRECTAYFDDGWFHLTLKKHLLDQEFIKQIDFD